MIKYLKTENEKIRKLQIENGRLTVLLIQMKEQIEDVIKDKKKNGKDRYYYGRRIRP
mgnify:CR=1 FL=1|jgi:hypothetical protein|tara:strand:- start:688 stop:858 length:171 start_codon:yes stop_codon:yes gene_type:complete